MSTEVIPKRWTRAVPDSSTLARARVLSRRLVPLESLDLWIAEYEALQRCNADLRMPIPDFGGLELAAIGGVLLIASERPFTAVQRRTDLSMIVPCLAEQICIAQQVGAKVLEPTEIILPGARARVLYPGGVLVELVEHRPLRGEAPASSSGNSPLDWRTLRPRVEVDQRIYTDTVTVFEQVIGAVAVADCHGARVGGITVVPRGSVWKTAVGATFG